MTTVRAQVGAVSHAEVDWHAIDWQAVNENVRRLQARIVKATREGRWNKVKALQRLLTRSFSGTALAVRRVTENQGKWTPGVDHVIWEIPQQKASAIHDLKHSGYRPQPLRRVYLKKSNGKLRPLGIPTMKDRAMQTLHLLALDPIAETTGDPNSYGFRPERSTADAIAQAFTVLSRSYAPQWILEGDIKSCFDTISHDWLLDNIVIEKSVLKKWLKAGFMDKLIFSATDEGTPQGGPISPVLANLTLDGLERLLREKYPQHSEESYRAKVNLIRYADDFFITGATKEVLTEEVMSLIKDFLKPRGLELSVEKTRITHIEDGFDFLGQNVRRYNGKLIIKPSKKNIQAFLDKVRGFIKANKQLNVGELIVHLNPLIRGWANYHQHIVSKRVFSRADHEIFTCLWRWAKRRHPNKGKRWVKARYFRTQGFRHWIFSGELKKKDGTKKNVDLLRADSTPIRRHVKIKGEANPYDPEWETYFEKRLDVKMEVNLRGRRKLLHLWKQQNGLCPNCNQKITKITGWHRHHIIWRSKGGSDGSENRVMLHPTCHQQIHSQGIQVVKPRPVKRATAEA